MLRLSIAEELRKDVAADLDALLDLGLDEPIPYTVTSLAEAVNDFDNITGGTHVPSNRKG